MYTLEDMSGSTPYIEIVSEVCMFPPQALQEQNLWAIGDFTRENIAAWLDRGPTFELGVYGWTDFHAVCGDIDIPWASEEMKNNYERTMRSWRT